MLTTKKAVQEVKDALHEANMTTYALDFIKESISEALENEGTNKFLGAMYANIGILHDKLIEELGKADRSMYAIDCYFESLGERQG